MPLCVPEVRGNEWAYVKECLDTGWVSSVGSFVDRFERNFALRVGTKFAVAVSTGTAALHLALLAAGVEPDDEVIVPALTFIAPANAVRYAGAWPVFIDAEPEYFQLDVARVAEFLETECESTAGGARNRRTGRRVRAMVPVHLLGHPVEMEPLLALARRYGLAVIEDATESLGARYRGHAVGTLGDMACFSFNGNKLITTGGGGMLVTDNEGWARRAKYLSTQAKDDPIEYVHDDVGFNYRLTNVQAAIGCAQLERIDEYVGAKRRIAGRYAETLSELPGIRPMREAPWAESAFWMYTVRIDPERYGTDSRALLARLEASGIQTRPLWQPLHLSRAHSQSQRRDCPVAERIHREALSLPCSVGLTDEEQERVLRALTRGVRPRSHSEPLGAPR